MSQDAGRRDFYRRLYAPLAAGEKERAEAARQKSDPGIRPGGEEKTGLTASDRESTAGNCPTPFRIDEMGPKGTRLNTHTENVTILYDSLGVPVTEWVNLKSFENICTLARRLAVALKFANFDFAPDVGYQAEADAALAAAKEAGLL